jgi:hypothetical protein
MLLLGGVWADQELFHRPPGDPDAYHMTIRGAAEGVPRRIGDWVGTDVDPPAAAVSLLRPNLLRGLRFENSSTKERATLMIVQCSDARDMTGHWPPNCYPAHGWTLRGTRKKVLDVHRFRVPVSVYQFTIEAIDRYEEILVYNFFARPDGVIEDGRAGVYKAAEDPRMKVFGAAQFQVVFESSMPEDRRDEVFGILIAGVLPLVEELLRGAGR